MNPPGRAHLTDLSPPPDPSPSLLGTVPSSVHNQTEYFQPQPLRPPPWQAQSSSWLSSLPPPILFTPPPTFPPLHYQQQCQFNLPMTLQGPRPAVLPVFVYHYTDKSGYENIMESGRIFASGLWKPKGIVYGNGVYLTALQPSSKTSCLMTNNYGNSSYCGSKNMVAKSEYSFEFQAWDLQDLRPVGGNAGRNIFLYPWPWIDLRSCPCMVYRRSVDDSQEEELNKVELIWKSSLIM